MYAFEVLLSYLRDDMMFGRSCSKVRFPVAAWRRYVLVVTLGNRIVEGKTCTVSIFLTTSVEVMMYW